MKATEKTINSVSIKMSFQYCTLLCISVLQDKFSSEKDKTEARNELIKYATELDRIDKLQETIN